MTTEAYPGAQGPGELHWIDGASHVDRYDKPEYVGPAIEKLSGFFCTRLAGAAAH